MLTIRTRTNNPFTKEYWKWQVRSRLLQPRGPLSVFRSLIRGLAALNQPCRVNPSTATTDVVVLSGVRALKDAIREKEAGLIKKLVAGPNIVEHPDDAFGIMQSPLIDTILVPSLWTADYWAVGAPNIANKIKVWPSGTAVVTASTRNGPAIIYNKLRDEEKLAQAEAILREREIPFRVFTYGSFSQQDYLTALKTAPYVIYLGYSESQGLALQEAWAHDVPTFVQDGNVGVFRGQHFTAEKMNAPYLTDEMGSFFSTPKELEELITEPDTYTPKAYCDTHLSDAASARILLSYI